MAERAHQVTLITGAGRGLGRAIAGALHRDGYKVAVTDVDEGAAVSVAQSLSADGRTARAYRLDVSSAEQVADVFASVTRDLGLPDALVNNAGIYPSRLAAPLSMSRRRPLSRPESAPHATARRKPGL